jgi:hypothetical protein
MEFVPVVVLIKPKIHLNLHAKNAFKREGPSAARIIKKKDWQNNALIAILVNWKFWRERPGAPFMRPLTYTVLQKRQQ